MAAIIGSVSLLAIVGLAAYFLYLIAIWATMATSMAIRAGMDAYPALLTIAAILVYMVYKLKGMMSLLPR
jgi:hypothetical protein